MFSKGLFRTLRFRLMVWNTGVVLLLVVVTLAGAREALRFALLREFDQLLQEDTLEIDLSFQATQPRGKWFQELNRKAQSHARHGWFVQILDAHKEVVWASVNTPEIEFPPLADEPTVFANAGTYRLAQSKLDRPGSPPLYVRVGSSLQSLTADIDLLTRMMLLAGGVFLVLVPLGGYWLSGRAVKPLARLIEATARLRPSNLEARLPIRPTGDEIDQLSVTINGLLDQIAAYVDQKRDYLANAAHELRSPLAAIQSSVEVALNSARTREEYVELLSEIVEECSNLRILLNQLLLLSESRVEGLTKDGGSVRLDELVRKSLAMFEGTAENRDIALDCSQIEPATVHGDENHLRQVVNNLIDNALKFNRPGGQVRVEVRVDANKKMALLRVRDTGAGISAEDLPHIFERFYRGDRSRQRDDPSRGYGLGLSICRSLVTAYGGEIAVDSKPGQGSTFTVLLPL